MKCRKRSLDEPGGDGKVGWHPEARPALEGRGSFICVYVFYNFLELPLGTSHKTSLKLLQSIHIKKVRVVNMNGWPFNAPLLKNTFLLLEKRLWLYALHSLFSHFLSLLSLTGF